MKEFTIRQAAEIRNVHPDTVRARIKAGKIIAHLKFVDLLRSNIYFIPESELKKITPEKMGRPKKRLS